MDTSKNEETSVGQTEIQTSTQNNFSPRMELPREHLIETAVKFLTNPKVVNSTASQKNAFLQKKGLTLAEIDEAVKRASAVVPSSLQVAPPNYTSPLPLNYSYPPPVPVSKWARFREIWYMAVIIGGTFYAAYILAKKYIIPYVLGWPKKEDRLSQLEKRVSDFQNHLDQNINQLHKTIDELQNAVRDACLKQDTNSKTENAAQTKATLDSHFTDLRSEIISLKGLFLNRHQFPAAPSVAPIIPSWQLEKQNAQENNVDELKGTEDGESEA